MEPALKRQGISSGRGCSLESLEESPVSGAAPERKLSFDGDKSPTAAVRRKTTVFVDNVQAFIQELHTHRSRQPSNDLTPRKDEKPVLPGSPVRATPEPRVSSVTPSAGGKKGDKENIKVAVRIRPKISRDADHDDIIRLSPDGCTISFAPGSEANSNQGGKRPGKTWTYDYVFDSRSSSKRPADQKRIFQDVGDRIVKGAVEGYNACLFAYGQTGTGKTHTVVGKGPSPGQSLQEQDERGVLPRILEGIFEEVERRRKEGRPVVVKISFLEIYNECINDLLVPPGKKQNSKEQSLAVRYTPGLGLVITDLSEPVATTFEEAYGLVDFGMKMRSIAATSMNSRSSRAHTVFTFRMEQEDDGGDTKMAQVQIIDLAGREQEKTSGDDRDRLRERAFINKSLFHLSTCISNLSRSNGKIPEWTFRNSKLTMVLTNSLGKNSRTSMIAAISPTAHDIDESISTLRFASQVKLIVNVTSCNTVNKRDLVAELKNEIERLKEEQAGEASRELQDQVAQLQALCSSYQESLAEEKERSKQLHIKQKETLVELGLSVSSDSPGISVHHEQDVPYLINLSEDPFLEGCLMYFIRKGEEPTTIGTATSNKIQLVGLGVATQHCKILNDDDESLVLSPISGIGTNGDSAAVPRTFLNGKSVTEPTEIKHKDRIIVGRAFAFKVVVPRAVKRLRNSGGDSFDFNQFYMGDIGDDDGGSTETLTQALAEVQEPNRVLVHHTCRRFTEHLGQNAANDFFTATNKAAGLVEEANVISREVRPEEFLEFRLQLLTDVLTGPMPSEAPEMVVAVMSRNPVDVASQVEDEASEGTRLNSLIDKEVKAVIKFVWSFDKFQNRLQAMKDFYEESQRNGLEFCMKKLRREPYNDPWKEIGMGEVQILLDGLAPFGAEVEAPGSTGDSSDEESDDESKSMDSDEDVVEQCWSLNDNGSNGYGGGSPSRPSQSEASLSDRRRLSDGNSSRAMTKHRSTSMDYSHTSSRSSGARARDGWYTAGRRLSCRRFTTEMTHSLPVSPAHGDNGVPRRGSRSMPISPQSSSSSVCFARPRPPELVSDAISHKVYRTGGRSPQDVFMATPNAIPPPMASTPSLTQVQAGQIDDVHLRMPADDASQIENNRIWKSLSELESPLWLRNERIRNVSDELQAKEAERSLKLKSWFSQIQTKEDILLQLKANLQQLRALDNASCIGSVKGYSPLSSPQDGNSPLSQQRLITQVEQASATSFGANRLRRNFASNAAPARGVQQESGFFEFAPVASLGSEIWVASQATDPENSLQDLELLMGTADHQLQGTVLTGPEAGRQMSFPRRSSVLNRN